MEKSDDEAIKAEILSISLSIDRILQKVAEYDKPAQMESEQPTEEGE